MVSNTLNSLSLLNIIFPSRADKVYILSKIFMNTSNIESIEWVIDREQSKSSKVNLLIEQISTLLLFTPFSAHQK
jgi:hypothetical protein